MSFLRESLHSLALQFIDALYLFWGKELTVALVVLLAQVKNLLATLHALFDGLLGFGRSRHALHPLGLFRLDELDEAGRGRAHEI